MNSKIVTPVAPAPAAVAVPRRRFNAVRTGLKAGCADCFIETKPL